MNSRYKVVVLDDNHQNLKLISDVLEDAGYDVSLCLTSHQLLDYLKEENELPDIIILDIMVPDIDGFEVCKIIKGIDVLKDIPIIFLSAKTETVDIVYGLGIGGVDYITKPFRPIELIARIKTHIEIKNIRDELKVKNNELIKLNQQLEEYAIKDPLTKLYNRRMMLTKFDEEINRCKRTGICFSIILLDIDKFKRVNDNYGHNFGDEVLKIFARLLTASKRLEDYVGRWGGEEFLIILPNTNEQGAVNVAQRIMQQVLQNEFIYENEVIHITATYGIAQYKKGDSVEKIIQKADYALYYGKEHGRDQINNYMDIH